MNRRRGILRPLGGSADPKETRSGNPGSSCKTLASMQAAAAAAQLDTARRRCEVHELTRFSSTDHTARPVSAKSLRNCGNAKLLSERRLTQTHGTAPPEDHMAPPTDDEKRKKPQKRPAARPSSRRSAPRRAIRRRSSSPKRSGGNSRRSSARKRRRRRTPSPKLTSRRRHLLSNKRRSSAT